jgi:integrase
LEDYARLHKKPKSVEDDTRYINKDINPRLGSKSLSEIRSKDIVKIHSSLAGTPIKANRLLALLSKIFNLSEEWEYRDPNTNPTQHIRKYKETPRERFLTQDEILTLEKVLADAERNNEVSPSVIHALRVLLMTGARLQEVLTMKWEYVDIEEGKINLPDSKSGKKTIWLSDKARDYIDAIPHKRGNPFVFPGQRTGSRLINLQKPWRKLRAIAEIEDVRIHDLRHTYASLAVSQNLSLPIVGKLLGHKSTKSTERYAHLYDDVMRDAANF